MFKDIKYFIYSFIEYIILYSRYLLVPLYCALMYEVVQIIIDFYAVMVNNNSNELMAHIIQILELLDVTMIANLIWFIAAGSFYVFVHPHPDETNRRKPRSLSHISTGILKEKMAGSIVGVSSVYLLQLFLNISTAHETVNIANNAFLLAIHFIFIVGLLAFNHANTASRTS